MLVTCHDTHQYGAVLGYMDNDKDEGKKTKTKTKTKMKAKMEDRRKKTFYDYFLPCPLLLCLLPNPM